MKNRTNYKNYQEGRYQHTIRRTPGNDPLLAKIMDELQFKKNDKVLDYGCGRGDYCFFLKYQVKKIIGIDINVELACKTYTQNTFIKQIDKKIAFPDNHFDKIICVNVIEHVEDYRYLLKELSRVLKKTVNCLSRHSTKNLF